MTELELHRPQPTNDLAVQMEYAKAVSVGDLLPQAYRGKPANVMIAMSLGRAMGLNEAESMYRIDVIQGKPTASAELIASCVRKAGHRLRTVVDEANLTATTSIWRSDDPDFEHKVTRDMAWAKRMGLDKKDNYLKQPATMLANRSITGAARLACPEALYGIAYTADEMADLPGVQPAPGLASVLQTSEPEESPAPTSPDSAADISVDTSGSESPLLNTSSKLAKAMYASINAAGITEEERLPYIRSVIGRDIESSKEMTDREARLVLDCLNDEDEVAEGEVVE